MNLLFCRTERAMSNLMSWNRDARVPTATALNGFQRKRKSQTPATHCTRKSPLPLLPSGPGGVGGSASRGTDA
jgi:hypothetical protein